MREHTNSAPAITALHSEVSRRGFLRGLGTAAAAATGLAVLGGIPATAVARNRPTPTPRPSPTPAPTPTPSMPTVRLCADLGIPSDGVTAVCGMIPQALARVRPGTMVVCDAPRFCVNGVMDLCNISNITLEGNGATFYRTGGNGDGRHPRPYLQIDYYNNFTLQNFAVEGFETSWRYSLVTEFDSGIRIRSGDGLVLRNVSVSRVGGDGVNILGRGTVPARNVLVDNVRVDCARRQGISIRQCNGVVVQNSYITWTGRSGFDIEPYAADWYADNITIRRTRLAHINNWIVAAGGEGRHDGHTIEELDAVGGLGFVMIGNRNTLGTRDVIRNNRYTWDDPEYRQDRSLAPMRIRASDAVSITGNDLNFRSGGAVEVRAPAGWVSNNRFTGTGGGLLCVGGVQQSNNVVLNRYGQPSPIVVLATEPIAR